MAGQRQRRREVSSRLSWLPTDLSSADGRLAVIPVIAVDQVALRQSPG